MTQIEILHVTDCYDGGVFTAINMLAGEIKVAKHSLLYAGNSNPPELFKNVHAFQSRNPIARIYQISKIAKKSKYSVIHLHSSRAGALSRLVHLNSKVIYQPHGVAFVSGLWKRPARWVFKQIERFLSFRTDIILGVSKYEVQEMKKISGKCPVLEIPNVSKLSRVPQRTSAKFTVLMSGRITDQKDPRYFADISLAMRHERANVEFVWLGDGDSSLKAYLELSGVRVTGWLGEEEIKHELATASCYLHTAIAEGFPITILDAARFDLPILIRNIPHLAGYGLMSFDSISQARDQIIDLFSNKNHAHSLKEISRQINNEHTSEKLVEKYRQALRFLGFPV